MASLIERIIPHDLFERMSVKARLEFLYDELKRIKPHFYLYVEELSFEGLRINAVLSTLYKELPNSHNLLHYIYEQVPYFSKEREKQVLAYTFSGPALSELEVHSCDLSHTLNSGSRFCQYLAGTLTSQESRRPFRFLSNFMSVLEEEKTGIRTQKELKGYEAWLDFLNPIILTPAVEEVKDLILLDIDREELKNRLDEECEKIIPFGLVREIFERYKGLGMNPINSDDYRKVSGRIYFQMKNLIEELNKKLL